MASVKTGTKDDTRGDVELLVMQAAIAINQSVYKHLRQFSLDRLKACNAGGGPVANVDNNLLFL